MPAGRWRRPALSLRWRLAGWVAGVMLSCAAVVFVVVYLNTGSQLRGQIDRDIASDTAQLSQSLRALRGRDSAKLLAAAERYMRAQPYRATSTLLFVLGPGGSLASNHPELFRGPRPEGSETPAEQAHENAEASRLRTPRLGYSVQEVPDVGRVRVLEHRLPDSSGVVVGAGEPLALVEQAQHGVARAFAIAGAIVLALALLASYLAAARITAPLRRMASVAARVDAGDLAPRMDASPRLAGELGVLTTAFNHMLDRLAEAFAAQREFIADASHELRTPLTVIRGQLEVLVAQEDPPVEEVRRVERLVQAEVTRISRLVDDLLVLAQSERTDFLRREEIELRSFVAELWDGLSLTARRRFELGPVPAGTLHADPDRVAQALRNLARNAIEHTAEPDGLVRLEVRRSAADGVRFTVIDDGPGIPAAERERVFERLHRLDAARSRAAGGAGLGLAIVRAVAEAHGGRVSAAEAPAGGAQIDLVLPGFAPAR